LASTAQLGGYNIFPFKKDAFDNRQVSQGSEIVRKPFFSLLLTLWLSYSFSNIKFPSSGARNKQPGMRKKSSQAVELWTLF